MSDKYQLPPFGELEMRHPRPSIIYDLISTWSANPSRAHMGRLCAASIAICLNPMGAPRYDTDQARPVAFGGLVMDYLISRGCSPSIIMEVGVGLLSALAPALLTEDDLKKKSTTTEPPPEGG